MISRPKRFILEGLVSSFIGVGLLAYFGFPSTFLELKVVGWGFELFDRFIQQTLSWWGVVFLLMGFALQFIGSYCINTRTEAIQGNTMKKIISFLTRPVTSFCGRKETTHTGPRPTPVDSTIEEAYRQYQGSYSGVVIISPERPFTLVDKVTIELLYGNYKSSQLLRQAIAGLNESTIRFAKTSSRLAIWMLILTVFIAILVGLQIWIMMLHAN